MNITILPLEDHKRYNVNGHTVYKDQNGRWESKTGMSTMEWNAFRNYENTVINNPRFKKHTKSTFKTK
ncbi:hypothetical protein [Flavobacterium geliluteum]|uniref:Uncharacterized protein n=1 Tax=Flavobacterium geliluteum TaxID=2816120 RepID=A0A940XCI8_9FLAO|nr:hypothetical protein [Flavobacterium geliluteum]MBP4139982.1 hypothetical protein [Flavobacterium geliluteum]